MLRTWNLLHKGENGRHTAQEYGNNEGNHTKGQQETDSLYTKDDKETGNTWGTCQT